LGLPRLLQINVTELESAYHDLGRRIHPDHFASAAPAVRDASLRATALVTRAYRTLREPVSRGLYWLELHGYRLADNNKQVPSELAELVFEVQEQLSELRMARAEGQAIGDALIELKAKRASLQGLMDELHAELAETFAASDATAWTGTATAALPTSEAHPVEEQEQTFTELKRTLSGIAYLRTLLRDVDRELEHEKQE
jgi:molecular chaperone HscB